jgi:hypothetical protein
VKRVVVADTGPLIILSGIAHLFLLKKMYSTIHIPQAVLEELQLGLSYPETKSLIVALNAGWIEVHHLKENTYPSFTELKKVVDPGEAEAIVLGKTIDCDFLIIDDRKGRKIAVNHGLQIVGVAGILLAAKHNGYIKTVKPLLGKMASLGYRLSSGLCTEIIRIAGEK